MFLTIIFRVFPERITKESSRIQSISESDWLQEPLLYGDDLRCIVSLLYQQGPRRKICVSIVFNCVRFTAGNAIFFYLQLRLKVVVIKEMHWFKVQYLLSMLYIHSVTILFLRNVNYSLNTLPRFCTCS